MRFKRLGGMQVPFTAAEEAQRDTEEAQWASDTVSRGKREQHLTDWTLEERIEALLLAIDGNPSRLNQYKASKAGL